MTEPIENTSGQHRCPVCGADLPPHLNANQCPQCLLRAGLDTQPGGVAVDTAVLPAPPPRKRDLPQPGELFGHYRILRLLGEGGMGAVYESEDVECGRRVALKVLGHTLDSPEARARFFREGRLAASINHPNSVYVFGTEEIAGIPVIAMELVPGGTLQQRVQSEGALPVAAVVDYALQIMAGLEAAQQIGILHRDVKPSNCFVDTDGTVKVGDFGLSISTQVRTEPALTVTGTFVGTPVFSSPEQLRGDELTVRSDIYSLGVTLYYLLTGKKPFEAPSLVQLLATVLEKRAESPAKWRSGLPKRLCRAVLKCLEKSPDDRFRNYAELRDALQPYASTAPTPATLGLRLLAGVMDSALLGVIQMALSVLWVGGWENLVRPDIYQNPRLIYAVLTNIVLTTLYYGLLEGLWGASLGKATFRLRVVRSDRNAPGVLRAWVRAVIFIGLPMLPTMATWWLQIDWSRAEDNWKAMPLSLGHVVIMGLLFVGARRRNGFAGLHDLATTIRVVQKSARTERPMLAAPLESLPDTQAVPQIGPYHILDTLAAGAGEELLLGFDSRLLRRVWIRRLPPGTPPVAPVLCQVGRLGRLRWLSGQRSPTEAWDAYEALTGQPLLGLLASKPGWNQVRFWLLDLAEELQAAEQDGSRPALLSLDRVWITSDNRAKLLDFALPGSAPNPHAPQACARPQDFLLCVARSALEGRPVPVDAAGDNFPNLPLALHAREILLQLRSTPALTLMARQLKASLGRPATVTRARRFGILTACLAVPLFLFVAFLIGMNLFLRMIKTHPENMVLNHCLMQVQMLERHTSVDQSYRAAQREAFAVYIAGRFRPLITNTVVWNHYQMAMSVPPALRQIAERIVATCPPPTAEELAAAGATVEKYFRSTPDEAALKVFQQFEPLPMALAMGYGQMLLLVIAPGWLAALLFRGGLMLLIFGVVVVNRDGSRASRGRVGWRGTLIALPFLLLPFLFGIGGALLGIQGNLLLTVVMSSTVIVLATLAVMSALLPERGLPDRLAGTWLVPR